MDSDWDDRPDSQHVVSMRFVTLVLALAASVCARELTLDGVWTLSNAERGIQVAGSVPGGVYSDLRRSGLLPQDLFYRFNDQEYRWVSKEDWTYSRTFHVPLEARGKRHQVLVFLGLDTVTSVYLNGQLLGTTDNMFVRYRFDVKNILKEAAPNTLEVRFSSPVRVAAELAAEQAKEYPVPPACTDPHYHGECGVNQLRKMQASFAWDWGPAFPSMGIWKSVRLESFDGAVVRDVSLSTRLRGGRWRAAVRVHWEAGGALPCVLTANLTERGGRPLAVKALAVTLVPDKHGAGHTDVVLNIPQSDVKLWWPQGLGEPTLYHLKVNLKADEEDQVEVKVGFRTVELVQEDVCKNDSAKGQTYYFRVNGRPVFAKGSNWIPAHILPERGAEPDTVRHLLHSAREANMNMLRVWGGGVYESDLFYQLADELGIMIWQDFMFACAMYPTRPAFLSSVSEEVRQQYRRLSHHPSVVLWAANNENEAALRGNWYGTTGALFERYHRDYVRLYVDTVRAAVRAEGSEAAFAVSSPSNGDESEREGYLARNPYSPLFGDDHHYDYVSDAWNPGVFHNTRFGSEYGFMSWPQLETMRGATDVAADLALGSELSDWRQHHPGGNREMQRQVRQHFNLPDNLNATEHYATFVYLTQVYQAMATKTETEFLRRSRNVLTEGGEGRTMGALYWQLNDVWQAPSWASIDYSGRWKMLHHFAVDFLSPLMVSPHVDGAGNLMVDVVCDQDLHQDVLVHTAVLSVREFAPPRLQRVTRVRVSGAGGTPRAWAEPLRNLLADCQDDCVLRFWLTDEAGGALSPDNYLLPRSPKDTALSPARFQVGEVSGPVAGSQHQRFDFLLSLSSSAPALFVWLSAGPHAGRFSSNGFHVTRAGPLRLRFHTDEEGLTAERLREAVSAVSVPPAFGKQDEQLAAVRPAALLLLSLGPLAGLVV